MKIYTKAGANGWWRGEVNGRVRLLSPHPKREQNLPQGMTIFSLLYPKFALPNFSGAVSFFSFSFFQFNTSITCRVLPPRCSHVYIRAGKFSKCFDPLSSPRNQFCFFIWAEAIFKLKLAFSTGSAWQIFLSTGTWKGLVRFSLLFLSLLCHGHLSNITDPPNRHLEEIGCCSC